MVLSLMAHFAFAVGRSVVRTILRKYSRLENCRSVEALPDIPQLSYIRIIAKCRRHKPTYAEHSIRDDFLPRDMCEQSVQATRQKTVLSNF